MRDRLKKILEKHCAVAECKAYSQDCTAEDCASCLADTILADGWIRPPCKVGDTVYKIMDIESVHRQILEVEVLSIRIEDKMKFFVKTVKNYLYRYAEYTIDDFDKTVFLTREEAEQALQEGK